jgi:predicted nuclease of predicted toxin-antitoxin system
MKFVADESLDGPIVDRLRNDGHRVLYVAELEAGISDDAVLDLANQELCLLITSDKDFGELVFRMQRISEGIVLVRLAGISPKEKAEIVANTVAKHSEKLLKGFTVISHSSVRIRKLP